MSAIGFRDSIINSLPSYKIKGIMAVSTGVVWVQLNGSFELFFGTGPIPIEKSS